MTKKQKIKIIDNAIKVITNKNVPSCVVLDNCLGNKDMFYWSQLTLEYQKFFGCNEFYALSISPYTNESQNLRLTMLEFFKQFIKYEVKV